MLRTEGGRPIYNVSFRQIRDGIRVTTVIQDGELIVLPSGPTIGSWLSPEDLDERSRHAYECWLAGEPCAIDPVVPGSRY